MEEDEAMEKELHAAIERTKALKLNTEHLKIQIKIEDDAHINAIQTWAKNLTTHKQVLTHLHTHLLVWWFNFNQHMLQSIQRKKNLS